MKILPENKEVDILKFNYSLAAKIKKKFNMSCAGILKQIKPTLVGETEINLPDLEKQKIVMEDKGKKVEIVNPFKEKVEAASFTFGLAAGAGFNIVQGLFIDLRYYMGLTELYPDVKGAVSGVVDPANYSALDMTGAKMMKFKVGLSYWFM